jgi:hypothetical protein
MDIRAMYPRAITLGAGLLAAVLLGHACADTVPITAVSFPKEVMPIEAGRIEFWAKLSGYSGAVGFGGGDPAFIRLDDQRSGFTVAFNANNGVANGGLTGAAASSVHTGTGLFGSWTYEDIFGVSQVEEWHHYVLQWNKNGLPGVDNGQQKIAIFVDGGLNSGSWHVNPQGENFVPLLGGTLNLITTGGAPLVSPGEIAIDELKIFDGEGNLILWNTSDLSRK